MPESGTPGSVRGVTSNGHSYRDRVSNYRQPAHDRQRLTSLGGSPDFISPGLSPPSEVRTLSETRHVWIQSRHQASEGPH